MPSNIPQLLYTKHFIQELTLYFLPSSSLYCYEIFLFLGGLMRPLFIVEDLGTYPANKEAFRGLYVIIQIEFSSKPAESWWALGCAISQP